MAMSVNSRWLQPSRAVRALLLKWLVALLVPLVLFTFLWSGEQIINNVLLSLFSPQDAYIHYTPSAAIQSIIFIVVFYATVIALAGYLVAADSGRRNIIELWLNVFFAVVVPLLLVILTNNLLIGLGLFAFIWPSYLFVRNFVRRRMHYTPPTPLEDVSALDAAQQQALLSRARAGGFWFALALALIWLLADILFFVAGSLPPLLLAWVAARTLLLPLAGYFLGLLGGRVALRRTIARTKEAANRLANSDGVNGADLASAAVGVSKEQQLRELSSTRAREEARNLVPNDQPLQSSGAWRFYLLLLGLFVLFYPVLDPVLFSYGSAGRLNAYGDLGYYIILALGLNIVVGFAGLLDLGYVAFFVIGTYAWAMIGSGQFTVLTGISTNPQVWSYFFWPMLIISALIAALWGVLLGAPTLRLRGDYLAIVTLGFGEIIPIIFLNMDKYTRGTNGISGIYQPATPCIGSFCINWNSSLSPAPYYYLILALIVLCIFANVRLRDSRLGRAWIAIREDEIAAASSGINLVNTKLFAFAAGAFFSGIAGAYHAAKLGTVNPGDFSSTDSIIFLAMVVIGGLGSIPGVIVGAVVVYALNVLVLAQLDSITLDPTSFLHFVKVLFPNFSFSDIRNLLFGALLIIVMIFRPEGLIPSARRRRELHHVEGTDVVEVTSLDATPGSPELEQEMRVE